MQYPADYTIQLTDGTKIPLLFNYWTFRTYSDRKGIEYEDLALGCFAKDDGTPGDTLRAKNFPAILLAGAECYHRYNATGPVPYGDLDACSWMDELGWNKGADRMAEICKIFMAKLLRVDLKDLEAKKDEREESETAAGEKKS